MTEIFALYIGTHWAFMKNNNFRGICILGEYSVSKRIRKFDFSGLLKATKRQKRPFVMKEEKADKKERTLVLIDNDSIHSFFQRTLFAISL